MNQAFPTDMAYESEVANRGAGGHKAFVVAPRGEGASLGDQQAEMGWASYLEGNPHGAEVFRAPSGRASSTLRIQRHVTCPYCRSQAYEITFAWTATGRLVRGACGLCGAHGEWHHLKAASG